MNIKYCIIHDHWYRPEHDNAGNEGHVFYYSDEYGEQGVDWCDFPLCTSEPPEIDEDIWEDIFEQEPYYPEQTVIDNEYADYEY